MSASATQLIARNSETTLLAAGSFVGARMWLEFLAQVFFGVMELVQLCPLRTEYYVCQVRQDLQRKWRHLYRAYQLLCWHNFLWLVMMTSPSHIYRFYYSPLETTHVINVATVLVRYIYRLVGPNKLINLGGWTVRSIRSISLALVHLLHLTNCLKVLLPWGTHAWSCTCHMRVVLLLLPQMEKKHPSKQQSWRQVRISKNVILYIYIYSNF